MSQSEKLLAIGLAVLALFLLLRCVQIGKEGLRPLPNEPQDVHRQEETWP